MNRHGATPARRLRLAVVGVGHLGKEHARILSGMPGVELVGVADARPEQARAVAQRCQTRPFTDYRDLLDGECRPDAAVVAVPTVHHLVVARDLLAGGISLLVEKPLAATVEEADELVSLARRQGVLLQVGHIERFNPAFEALSHRSLQPRLINCQRLSPFSGRSLDIGVVLDLMIHDLDLLLTLMGTAPVEVSAVGLSLLGGHEDLAQTQLTFAGGCVAHLSASRVHTGPLRQMEVWAAEGFACADFHRRQLTLAQPSALLRQVQRRRGALDEATLASLRTGLHETYLERTEHDCNQEGPDQLTRELTEFVASVQTGAPIRVTGEHGRDALALACRILDSMDRQARDGRESGVLPLGPLFPTADPGAAA
jgi:predicted dehydrogenase